MLNIVLVPFEYKASSHLILNLKVACVYTLVYTPVVYTPVRVAGIIADMGSISDKENSGCLCGATICWVSVHDSSASKPRFLLPGAVWLCTLVHSDFAEFSFHDVQ